MIPFSIANNWEDYPEIQLPLVWQKTAENEVDIAYTAGKGDLCLKIRLNDFPVEPLYSLIANGEVVMHFDDWPEFWGQCPLVST